MSGDMFLSVTTWGAEGGGAEPRDAAKHPTAHRMAPTTENAPAPHVNSEGEKPWTRRLMIL